MRNGKAISKIKASPFYCGQDVLSEEEKDEARNLINVEWGMVNEVANRFGYDKPHCKK